MTSSDRVSFATMLIIIFIIHLLLGGYIYTKTKERVDMYEENDRVSYLISETENMNKSILLKHTNWIGLTGDEFYNRIRKDLDRFAKFNNKTIINKYDGVTNIKIDENELTVTNTNIEAGYSCYVLTLGNSFDKTTFRNINEKNDKYESVIRGRSYYDWEHYSIGKDIKDGIKKEFHNASIKDIYNSCYNGSERIDIKLYKVIGD